MKVFHWDYLCFLPRPRFTPKVVAHQLVAFFRFLALRNSSGSGYQSMPISFNLLLASAFFATSETIASA